MRDQAALDGAVAQAIADGLSDSDAGPVQVVDVGSAPSPLPDGVVPLPGQRR